ncbi:MAG TPA: YkvA family protein [Longimicrobium sp.]|nr:YkvA family protein [Longimicrobium sp.]
MHYSDDEQPPRRNRSAAEDDELVGPRRGGPRPRPGDEDDEDLVGPRRGGGGRGATADAEDGHERGGRARRSILDDDEDDLEPRPSFRPRGPTRRKVDRDGASLMSMVRDVPAFLKLLARLATDPRVSKVDKAIVAATLVYLVSPIDLVPDWVVPVVGQIEDIYLLALALSRLVNNAGMEVLEDHWEGDPGTLEAALGALNGAAALLPGPIRSLLGQRG